MKLNIPLVRQPKNSVDCGIAGIAMLFKYYNIPKSFNDIKKEIEVDAIGTYSPQLGTYLIKHNFDVNIITIHPKLFTLQDTNMSTKDIQIRLNEKYTAAKTDQEKKALKYFQEFLEYGGKIIVKIPEISDIKEEIDNKRPVAALMTTNFINHNIPLFNFHFNIITGYDKEYIYSNDPLNDHRGGEKKYTIPQFYYGLYASAYGDIDNASLMIIKKK